MTPAQCATVFERQFIFEILIKEITVTPSGKSSREHPDNAALILEIMFLWKISGGRSILDFKMIHATQFSRS